MNFSDETLMAYADGELDAETRAAIEAAMAASPDVAAGVARHRALTLRLRANFDTVLDEKVPDRLIAATRLGPSAGMEGKSEPPRVADLDMARIARAATVQVDKAGTVSAPPRRRTLPYWSAVAASLLVGFLAGQFGVLQSSQSAFGTHNGHMVASGVLAQTLSVQLAAAQTNGAPVRVGISFLARSGDYCRTFQLAGDDGLAGLACKSADRDWRVQMLTRSAAAPTSDASYRTAATEIPRAVLAAVDDAISGEPLDADGEKAAMKKGWRK